MNSRLDVRRLLPIAGLAGAMAWALWPRRHESTNVRQFRALTNAGSALVRLDNEAGSAAYFNDAWLTFTRRSRLELIGLGWLEDVHPDDRHLLTPSLRRAALSESARSIEYRLRRHDGEYRWMMEHSSPYRPNGKLVNKSLSSLIDISDLKRAEDGLRLLAATGAMIGSSSDTNDVVDRFARHLTESFADCCVVHLLRDGELRLESAAASNPHHSATLAAAMRASQASFNESEFVERVRRERNPIVIDVEQDEEFAKLTNEWGASNAILGVIAESMVIAPMTVRGRLIGTLLLASVEPSRWFNAHDFELVRSLAQRLSDIIENARLFAETQAAEERYRRFFSASADAIIVTDKSLAVLETNPAFDRLYGARPALIVGRALSDLLTLPSEAIESLNDSSRTNDWRGNLRLNQSDGGSVAVEAWLGTMTVSEEPFIMVAIRDISERAQFEESRRRLLASVSHDLKNPLNSIKANAQLAKRQISRGTIDLAQAAETFSRIDSLSNRMVSQIADLMDVSLIDAGAELDLELSEVDLLALTRVVVDQYQATTLNHDIVITADLESAITMLDPRRIERVLTNVLTNAIKYSPDGGEIGINIRGIEREGVAWIQVSVTDRGIGIESGDLPGLFTKIGRGRNVAERFSGTGIGLVGVSQIVKQHGGFIEVQSEVGEGSTFTISLPVTRETGTA